MAAEHDDVNQLLSEIQLADFNYRSFDQAERDRPTLRIVRPTAAKPAAAAKTVAPPMPAPAPALTAGPRPTAQVSAAFERLARGSMAASAPRLNLKLNLPLRPEVSPAAATAPAADRRLQDVFRRLQGSAVLAATVGAGIAGSGN